MHQTISKSQVLLGELQYQEHGQEIAECVSELKDIGGFRSANGEAASIEHTIQVEVRMRLGKLWKRKSLLVELPVILVDPVLSKEELQE